MRDNLATPGLYGHGGNNAPKHRSHIAPYGTSSLLTYNAD